jgi:uncharacterized protein
MSLRNNVPYLVDTIIPPSAAVRRSELRHAHLAYLEEHADTILAAGAKLLDDGAVGDGSFYLLDLETLADAQRFMSQDPYVVDGIVTTMSLKRVRNGFFDRRRTAPKS